MAPPKRKIAFDPQSIKDSVKRKKLDREVSQRLDETAIDFSNYVSQLSEEYSMGEIKSVITKELFLVIINLGLKGINTLRIACNIVSDNYPNRVGIITSMINHVLPIPVSQSKYNALLEVLNMTTLNNVATTSDTDLLWQMTLTTGQPFIFLTPPVSTCQNACCKRSVRKKASLYTLVL